MRETVLYKIKTKTKQYDPNRFKNMNNRCIVWGPFLIKIIQRLLDDS